MNPSLIFIHKKFSMLKNYILIRIRFVNQIYLWFHRSTCHSFRMTAVHLIGLLQTTNGSHSVKFFHSAFCSWKYSISIGRNWAKYVMTEKLTFVSNSFIVDNEVICYAEMMMWIVGKKSRSYVIFSNVVSLKVLTKFSKNFFQKYNLHNKLRGPRLCLL